MQQAMHMGGDLGGTWGGVVPLKKLVRGWDGSAFIPPNI